MPSPTQNEPRANPGRPSDPGRRRFFAIGAGATAASAAALGAAQAIESPDEQVDQRYSRTPHVERYYALNRL